MKELVCNAMWINGAHVNVPVTIENKMHLAIMFDTLYDRRCRLFN